MNGDHSPYHARKYSEQEYEIRAPGNDAQETAKAAKKIVAEQAEADKKASHIPDRNKPLTHKE